VELEFTGDVWFWRGPAPFYFVTVPEPQSVEIEATSSFTSYGWGCIPVRAQIGDTGFTTSLFPKDGGYIVPVKAAVRRAEHLDAGDTVTVRLSVDVKTGARGL
jgi:hypothetical protein